MDENKRHERYPSIFYSKDLKWCAYNFSILTQVYNPDADDAETVEIRKERDSLDILDKKFRDKFPFKELVKKHEQETNIKRFTDIKTPVVIAPNAYQAGILIYSNIPLYATQLNIEERLSFLQTGMHNGGIPSIGLLMAEYGLRAIKTIYSTYGIETSHLPTLNFQKETLEVTVPIIHIDEKREYDLEFNGITPTVLEDRIEFEVKRSSGKPIDRTHTAFILLEKATSVARMNLYRFENVNDNNSKSF